MSDDDLLKDAQEAFQTAAEAEQENREAYLDDTNFAKLGKQWPDNIRAQRVKDGRPCLVINKLPPIIRQVVNDGRQNRAAVKVHPADSNADPETAEIFNGLIRNIEYCSSASVAYETALDCSVTGGFGYWRINTRYASDDTFDQDLVIERIANPLSVYGDPHSTAADSSDWNTAFVTDMLTRSEFRRRWKGAQEVDWDELGYGDGKLAENWCEGDGDQQRIMVAEWWTREEVAREIVLLSTGEIVQADILKKLIADGLEGVEVMASRKVASHQVRQRIMTGAEVLETNDWAGKYIPLIPVYGEEVNIEGRRHFLSLIRHAKDAQQHLNFSRSGVTEAVNLAPKAPFIGPVGAFTTDADKWATANTANHAFIEYDWEDVPGAGPPQRQGFSGVPAGLFQEALNANDDIMAITGIHEAGLGIKSNETSGRAILARQREGDVSTFHFHDNLSRAIEHTGRVLVDLIPHVYPPGRVLRVLGADSQPSNIRTGTPQEAQASAQALAQKVEGVERIYSLSAGKYDLTVETGPSFTTRREEAVQQMLELIRVFPQAASVLGDLLAKNLDWPDADEIAKRLHALLPPAVKGEDPQNAALKQQAQQMIGQLQQTIAALQAKLKDAESQNALDAAKVQIDAFKAQTDRMEAQADIASQVMRGLPAPITPSGF